MKTHAFEPGRARRGGRRLAMALGVLLALAGSAAPAAAQNLLVNPNFDSSATGWSLNPPGAFDSANDAGGSLTSGSVQAPFAAATINSVPLFQCVSGIVAGNSYSFGGSILIDQAAGTAGVQLVLDWFTDSACSSNNGLAISPSVSTLNAWTPTSNPSAVAPAGTNSASIVGFVTTTAAATAHFDDMFVQSNAVVPTLGTSWLTTLGLCLFGIASAALMRRNRLAAS